MARRVDHAAAKQARQKKIAIGGFVVLLAVLAISVPRTLKMMNPPQAAATPAAQPSPAPAATSPTSTATAAATTPAATPADATPAATTADATPAAPADATLADTGAQPQPGEGQLTAFERFETKDPFAQQAVATPAPAAPAAQLAHAAQPAPAAQPAARAQSAAAPARPQAQPPTPAVPTPAPAQPATPTPTPAPAPVATPAPKPTSAVIAVNGVRETVALHTAFPAADKVFELRSIGASEIKIGIAGGSLTGGAQTVALKKGKKVTLMNTADGTRYELALVSLA